MSTLFEKIGREAAVDATVDKFYEKVLADEAISAFFDGVDMKKQAAHGRLATAAGFTLPRGHRYSSTLGKACASRTAVVHTRRLASLKAQLQEIWRAKALACDLASVCIANGRAIWGTIRSRSPRRTSPACRRSSSAQASV